MIQNTHKTLPSLKILLVNGQDALKFLQGQLTCDVAALADGQSQLGAYCNIKGKVESLFNLSRKGDDFLLSLHQDLAQPTWQELKKYAVFSKVKLELIDGAHEVDEKQEILAKIPALYAATIGVFFPHDINLPQLGAVSFTKGCYRGQEIVARMEHRGNIKRSLYAFTMPKTQLELAPGNAVLTADAAPAGTVVRFIVAQDMILGLAVINDALCKEPLQFGNTPLKLA